MRRIFDAQKAGHAGTLDPLATGILAIALGEATKTVPFAMDADKIYRFTASWGEARDSDDAEGKVTGTSDVRPSREAIEAMLPRFTGALTQVPPAYSAIKVAGERAYDLAREGEEVNLEPRQVEVYRGPAAERRTGPGGVRNPLWQRDLRPVLGARYGPGAWALWAMFRPCGAPAWAPSRKKTRSRLETLTPFMHSPAAFAYLRPLSTALDGIPALAVTGSDTVRLRSGNPILIRANLFARMKDGFAGDGETSGAHGLPQGQTDGARGIGRNRRRRTSAVSRLQL